jgi:hypothetical protein
MVKGEEDSGRNAMPNRDVETGQMPEEGGVCHRSAVGTTFWERA